MNTICVFIEKIARTTQTKKISKNLPEQKSRNPLCIKGFWDFLFDEKLRETREKLSKKRSNAEPGKKEKSLENIVFSRLFMWEDYKIDFFAFLGVVFVPLRKILSFQG